MIGVNCPGCGLGCEFADFLGGLTAVCKNCGHRIPVPASGPKVLPARDAIQSAPGAMLPQAPAAPPPPRPSEGAIQSAPRTTPSPAAPAAPEEVPEAHPSANGPSDPPPDWAVEYVRASLRIGLSVPDIEQRLVARGLTPAVAAAVVTSVLEGQVGGRFESLEQGERRQLVYWVLSGVVACACLLLAYWFGGGLSVGKTALWVLMPLACIWFPDRLPLSANSTGVRLSAWLLLLVIGGYRIVLLLIIAS